MESVSIVLEETCLISRRQEAVHETQETSQQPPKEKNTHQGRKPLQPFLSRGIGVPKFREGFGHFLDGVHAERAIPGVGGKRVAADGTIFLRRGRILSRFHRT